MRVATVEGEAKKNQDYTPVDKVIKFKQGESEQSIDILIKDDDDWNPDRDFFVKLYDAHSGELLEGKDRETRITIIDDDKPGNIAFEKKDGSVKVSSD